MRIAIVLSFVLCFGCGDGDDDGTEAQKRGLGAACAADSECSEAGQRCLPFKGGYCGLSGCAKNEDCPAGSACVAHDDGTNYCFLVCAEKIECNPQRPLELESNCSSNITFTDGKTSVKACVPPSG